MTETFIKPAPNHWKPDDFDLSNVRLEASLLHITKTICLLESRCDDYAEYLQAILRDRDASWTSAISRWNFEECQHGVVLRAMCEGQDDRFEFDSSMSKYEALVSYHAPTGESVRGSVAAEMVSRCVVEALASTLYRVLADTAADHSVKAVYSALAQDEARHYGMFLKMLNTEAIGNPKIGLFARTWLALRRMLELEDAQIMPLPASLPVARPARSIGDGKQVGIWPSCIDSTAGNISGTPCECFYVPSACEPRRYLSGPLQWRCGRRSEFDCFLRISSPWQHHPVSSNFATCKPLILPNRQMKKYASHSLPTGVARDGVGRCSDSSSERLHPLHLGCMAYINTLLT